MHTVYPSRRILATTSFWCCWRPNFWNGAAYPDIDYADWHSYVATPGTENPAIDNQGPSYVNSIASFVRDIGNEATDGYLWVWNGISIVKVASTVEPVKKPIIIAETGLGDASGNIVPELTNPNPGIWYHNLLWAQLNAASVSVPNYWYSAHIDAVSASLGSYTGIRAISKPFWRVYGNARRQ